jgi:hypothetical protein
MRSTKWLRDQLERYARRAKKVRDLNHAVLTTAIAREASRIKRQLLARRED